MSEVNYAALIAVGSAMVVVLNGLGLAWIAYLSSKTKAETSETKIKVEKLTQSMNGPHTLALETIRNQARTIYESQGGEANRQKLLNAEEALKTHEEGKQK